uniref:DUF228 domain-containing protein n=1 Tax=Borreliella bavariensis TaxID=664662 RepID=UPI001C006EC5
PTVINAYALSDSFTINFAPEDENQAQSQDRYPRIDYSINLIKVAIFGNRGLEKIINPDAGG